MDKYYVELYSRKDGYTPVKDFLQSLSKKMQAKIIMEIDLLEEYWNELDGKYTKFLSEGIFELRAKVGSDVARILFFYYPGRKIVLTNGFIKKTQKTPRKEIDFAKKCRNDYKKTERGEK